MAIEKKHGFWFDGLYYYSHEPFETGDTVEYAGSRSSTYDKGDIGVVSSASRGRSSWEYVGSSYNNVYTQDIKIQGDETKRSAKHWNKTEKKKNMLAIESNDPCFVQEFEETVVEGKTVVKSIGNPLPMANLSAARTYTSNEITNSIREKNLYRQFEIYQRRHIARAKKPEIEFA